MQHLFEHAADVLLWYNCKRVENKAKQAALERRHAKQLVQHFRYEPDDMRVVLWYRPHAKASRGVVRGGGCDRQHCWVLSCTHADRAGRAGVSSSSGSAILSQQQFAAGGPLCRPQAVAVTVWHR